MDSFWLFFMMFVLWAPLAWSHFKLLRFLDQRVRRLEKLTDNLIMDMIVAVGTSDITAVKNSLMRLLPVWTGQEVEDKKQAERN